MNELRPFKVLTFDCYGTLIDWERGLLDVLRPYLSLGGAVADESILAAFSEAEPACQRENPTALYPNILRAAYGRVVGRLGVAAPTEGAEALAGSVGDWPTFKDTREALQRLKRRCRLVIISNVDRASFARTNEKLGVAFDAIITAEDAGAYKPALNHFHLAAERVGAWGVDRAEWLHVAQSLFHDHVPAKSMGLRTAWIHRRRDMSGWGATLPPEAPVTPDWVFGSLAEFADALDDAFAVTGFDLR